MLVQCRLVCSLALCALVCVLACSLALCTLVCIKPEACSLALCALVCVIECVKPEDSEVEPSEGEKKPHLRPSSPRRVHVWLG